MTDGSPAAAAGLPIGSVITKVDDVVTGSANALVAAVRSRAPGTQINLGCVEPSGVSRTVRSPWAATRDGWGAPSFHRFMGEPPIHMCRMRCRPRPDVMASDFRGIEYRCGGWILSVVQA